MKRSLIILIILLVILPSAVTAEGTLTMDMSLYNSILRIRDAGGDLLWSYVPTGSADLSYKSTGNRNVKSEISLQMDYPNAVLAATSTSLAYAYPLLSLDKAYIKARFPEFRLTAGKTRLNWGDGFVFNAGDILSDSVSTSVDLTSSEVRSDTYWMASVNVPLGRFSFVEAVVLPPTEALLEEVSDTSAGARLYTTVDSLKIETGYMYHGGDEAYHQVSLGLQGNLEADWYLSGAVSLPGPGHTQSMEDLFEDTLDVTAGLFYIYQLDSVRTLTLRVESLIQPFESWAEVDDGDDYGILLYPEIGFTPSDTVSLSLRSIYSPIDGSAQVTAGGSWNVFQGFSLLGYLIGQLGDENDLYSWGNETPNWTSLAGMVGINYIY